MSSFLVMVDAGWIYASAGTLIHGTKARHELLLNCGALRDLLESFGREAAGVPMLRMYWYDAARNRTPTSEHNYIAGLSAVQLRLGRLTESGRQKGVDSLIYRDLFTLSQSGRVSEVFLVAGDEDLLEGVNAAKDVGVRVSLIGIENQQRDQSEALRHAADAIYVLQRKQLEPIIHRRQNTEGSTAAASDSAMSSLARVGEAVGDGPADGVDGEEHETRTIAEAAARIARQFWETADIDARNDVEREFRSSKVNRRLPQQTDGWMLREASNGLGRRLEEKEKWRARDEFWNEILAILDERDTLED